MRQSHAKAFECYLRAARARDSAAQAEVARCFYYGIGVTKDIRSAAHWYRKAAKQGVRDAQYAIGLAYEYGDGVGRKRRMASHWYKTAVANGHIDAERALQRVKKYWKTKMKVPPILAGFE